MNQQQIQSVLARLNIAIGLLSDKEARPQEETDEAVVRGLESVRESMVSAQRQQQDILTRMTPSLVASTLDRIATDIRDEQVSGMSAEHFEIDIIHLRQIADWLESKQEAGKH